MREWEKFNFKQKVKQLDNEIEKHYKSEDIIIDGIINIENYINSNTKILWILKEPYNHNENGLGWDQRQKLNNAENIDGWGISRQTHTPIIYISYSILNNLGLYNKIPDIREKKVFTALKDIAIINIKKIPGSTISKYSKIGEAFFSDKEILYKQINIFDPDIIIGGSTLYLLVKDHFKNLDWENGEGLPETERSYFIENNILFIDARHPSRQGINQEAYCNEIIRTVRKWKKLIDKN